MALGIKVTAIFAPEHGFRGEADAGAAVGDSIDARTGIPVYSLYGAVRKPTAAMLGRVDVLVYDIQDVGVRFYTYISTMSLCMEAAGKYSKQFIVLDRPNPIGMMNPCGPIRDDSLRSFVGYLPIPIVYGLTPGELATMAKELGWLEETHTLVLDVVPMEGWHRSMRWEETGLSWTPPSPALKTPTCVYAYPATCLLEASNFSEGRGTVEPFALIGAPWVKANDLRELLRSAAMNALALDTVSFIPSASKHTGLLCHGIRISVHNPGLFRPDAFGLAVLSAAYLQDTTKFSLKSASIRRLLGKPIEAHSLHERPTLNKMLKEWDIASDDFLRRSKRFMLYPR
jgi:uncharacterized protein YbbC (DUF1343 family)